MDIQSGDLMVEFLSEEPIPISLRQLVTPENRTLSRATNCYLVVFGDEINSRSVGQPHSKRFLGKVVIA